MKIALFGGSFDPVHKEHVRLVWAAIGLLGLDRVVVMPTKIAPHKRQGARVDGNLRLKMCQIAFRDIPQAEVSDFELSQDGTSFSYLTCREFARRYPDAERYFLIGADMLEDFFTWKNPDDIIKNVTIAACCRGNEEVRKFEQRFAAEFGKPFLALNFTGEEVSSTQIRVELAFEKNPPMLDGEVCRWIKERHLYEYSCISPALALETPERREHTFRVAQMACMRAHGLGIAEEKALLAAALHDCAKYVPLDSPLLKGFEAPQGVPPPVMHQFSGAYLAEHAFGIKDGEILNAIRFHTSGRTGMSDLEKLIFLADLLESGRVFPDVELLREAFWRNLDECLYLSLKHQVDYLNSTGKPIFPLTEQAYTWICRIKQEN